MKKQYAILGLGKFGYAVATALAQSGCEVLVVDENQELIDEIADLVTYAIRADITDTRVFSSLGIGKNMDAVIVGIADDMQASILATIQAKEAGVPLVIAKCTSEIHADILRRVGADQVIMAERETGTRLARNLVSGGFADLFMLSDTFSMAELELPEAWVGKNLITLNLRQRFGVNVVAVKRGNEIYASIDPQESFQKDDNVILVGANKDLANLKARGTGEGGKS